MTSHDRAAEAAFSEDDERQMLDAIEKWLERDVRPQVRDLEHADTLSARDGRADACVRPVRRDDRA